MAQEPKCTGSRCRSAHGPPPPRPYSPGRSPARRTGPSRTGGDNRPVPRLTSSQSAIPNLNTPEDPQCSPQRFHTQFTAECSRQVRRRLPVTRGHPDECVAPSGAQRFGRLPSFMDLVSGRGTSCRPPGIRHRVSTITVIVGQHYCNGRNVTESAWSERVMRNITGPARRRRVASEVWSAPGQSLERLPISPAAHSSHRVRTLSECGIAFMELSCLPTEKDG